MRSPKKALVTEAAQAMGKESIIFFDKLGFGWVVDSRILNTIEANMLREADLPSRSLIKIIENILSEKSVM